MTSSFVAPKNAFPKVIVSQIPTYPLSFPTKAVSKVDAPQDGAAPASDDLSVLQLLVWISPLNAFEEVSAEFDEVLAKPTAPK